MCVEDTLQSVVDYGETDRFRLVVCACVRPSERERESERELWLLRGVVNVQTGSFEVQTKTDRWARRWRESVRVSVRPTQSGC